MATRTAQDRSPTRRTIFAGASFLSGALVAFLLNFNAIGGASVIKNVASGPDVVRSEREEQYNERRFKKNILAALQRSPGQFLKRDDVSDVRESLDTFLATDPIQCVNFLSEHAGSGLVSQTDAYNAISNFAKGNPFAILSHARKIENGTLRDFIIERTFTNATAADPEKAFEELLALPSYLQNRLEKQLMSTWIQKRGLAALERVAKEPQSSEHLFLAAVSEFGETDPERALEFVEKLPEDLFRQRLGQSDNLKYRIILLNKLDPEKALKTLSTQPSSFFRESKFVQYTAKIIRKDPANAAKLIAESNGNQAIISAVQSASSHKPFENPKATAMLVNALPGERLREYTVTWIAKQFRSGDEEKTLEFTNAISDPLTRARAISELRSALRKRGISIPQLTQ